MTLQCNYYCNNWGQICNQLRQPATSNKTTKSNNMEVFDRQIIPPACLQIRIIFAHLRKNLLVWMLLICAQHRLWRPGDCHNHNNYYCYPSDVTFHVSNNSAKKKKEKKKKERKSQTSLTIIKIDKSYM